MKIICDRHGKEHCAQCELGEALIEIDRLKEKLKGHDCAYWGPNECGDCCNCIEMQLHHALDNEREENKKLKEELHRRDMEIAELRATDAWLRKVLYNAENGYCVHGDGIPGIIECKVDKPCFVCEQNAKIEKLEQKIEDFYDKEHDLD